MAKRGRPGPRDHQPERADDPGAMGAAPDDGAGAGATRAHRPACAAGQSTPAIAAELRITRQTVGRWRGRFLAKRLDGLLDEPRPGAPRRITDAQVERLIMETLENQAVRRDPLEHPLAGQAGRPESQHGRPDLARLRAAAASQRDVQAVARSAVHREGARHGRPVSRPAGPRAGAERGREEPDPSARSHRADSADDVRLARAADARLPPPRHDVAVCGARCRDRQGHRRVSSAASQPGVPAVPRDDRRQRAGGPRRASHPRQLRHAQDRAVRRWFATHPRFHVHFTPTSASWLNLVERWFALLSQKQIKRGAHRSVRALETAIREYIAITNEAPKPFVWTKTADEILAKVARFCQRISNPGHYPEVVNMETSTMMLGTRGSCVRSRRFQ